MSVDSALLQHQLDLYKGLVEVSALINGITESAELMPAILEVARRVMRVEAASLFLVNGEGDLEMQTASSELIGSGLPPERIVVPRGRGISGWVMEHRKALHVPDAYADPRFFRDADRVSGFRTRSLLCAPLIRGGNEIGVLQVLNPKDRVAFDEADLSVFEAYGMLAATAIDKLRTIERLRDQQRLTQEFSFARDIQKSLLPRSLPAPSGLRFAATYRPARQVGGDFYDVIEMAQGEFFFVIGDVSGKGMPAALLMAQALSTLRSLLRPGASPATLLSRWNDLLCGQTIRGMFITALIGRIDVGARTVEFANAGHCHPIRVSRTAPPIEIPVPSRPPLGILPNGETRSLTTKLEPGEWLVAFTDGLVESFSATREPLATDGIGRLLSNHFPEADDVVDALDRGELDHRGPADPHDDLTVLVFGFR